MFVVFAAVFFSAGLTKETMNGLECGIYVGCATLGGIEPDIPAFGPFTNIGREPLVMGCDTVELLGWMNI